MKEFWENYKGAIIGVIVAILILCTRLYYLILSITLILVCGFLGYYMQINKNEVKDRIKKFLDKM